MLYVISSLNSLFPFIKLLLRNTAKYWVNETCSLVILLQDNDNLEMLRRFLKNRPATLCWTERVLAQPSHSNFLYLCLLYFSTIIHITLLLVLQSIWAANVDGSVRYHQGDCPGGPVVKYPSCYAGGTGSILGQQTKVPTCCRATVCALLRLIPHTQGNPVPELESVHSHKDTMCCN